MAFKINVSHNGKTYKLESENEVVVGKKIGETLNGTDLNENLSGYELEITGTSDLSGIPGFKGLEGPGYHRQLLTKGANFYIRLVLGVKVQDCNSGFRGFRRKVFEAVPPKSIIAPGPDIVQEVLYRAHLAGMNIAEIPIDFIEREEGNSKLGYRHLWRGYTKIIELRWLRLRGKI